MRNYLWPGGDEYVITLTPRQVVSSKHFNRELITMGECISAAGEVIPPLLIIKGKHFQERWVSHSKLQDDVLLSVSDTGYINDLIALKWLEFFHEYKAKRQKGLYRLLILDGHESHITVQFLKRCEELKIIVFLFVPHTTHLCQPPDVRCFQPLKHYHHEAVAYAMRCRATDFDRLDFFSFPFIYPPTDFQAVSYQIRLSTCWPLPVQSKGGT
jgi:DDE superfamily endonuclease